MFKSPDLEVQPGLSKITVDRYQRGFDRIAESLSWRFDRNAASGVACFLAVRGWMMHQSQFPPYKFGSMTLVFDQEVKGTFGNKEVGQEVLTLEHPHHPEELILTVDVAGYLFGAKTLDDTTSVLGNRNFIGEAFSKIYGDKYPGIRVEAPKIHTPSPVLPAKVLVGV